MTTEEIAAHLTDKVLVEFFDCYLLIGETPTGEPFIRGRCKTKEHADRINSIMLAILQSEGVPYDG